MAVTLPSHLFRSFRTMGLQQRDETTPVEHRVTGPQMDLHPIFLRPNFAPTTHTVVLHRSYSLVPASALAEGPLPLRYVFITHHFSVRPPSQNHQGVAPNLRDADARNAASVPSAFARSSCAGALAVERLGHHDTQCRPSDCARGGLCFFWTTSRASSLSCLRATARRMPVRSSV